MGAKDFSIPSPQAVARSQFSKVGRPALWGTRPMMMAAPGRVDGLLRQRDIEAGSLPIVVLALAVALAERGLQIR